MKKISLIVVLILSIPLLCVNAQTSTDDDMKDYEAASKAYEQAAVELTRVNLRTQKRLAIQKTASLTDDENKTFWPIYDNYEAELTKLNDDRLAIIMDYAKYYRAMTDEKALELIARFLEFESQRVALRKQYLTRLKDVFPGRIVARLMQLEDQTELLIDLNIASQIPLVK